MPSLTFDEMEEFLKEYKVAHVATLSADGSPYVVPASFLYTGSAILLTPRGKSAWYRNLQRDTRVSVAIDEINAPFRRFNISNVKADVLYEPGREKEWVHIKRQVEIKGMSEEAADRYLEAVEKIPYALYSIPFEYPSPSVLTWRVAISGNDLTGLMSTRYGTITNPESKLSGFEGFKNK